MRAADAAHKRRADARALIIGRGLRLTDMANGKARITGRGVNLLIADLALLIPADLDGGTRQNYQ